MSKLKVYTVVGTRPEIIRLSRVIDVFDKNFSHTLVHTGQNYDYELNEIFFEELKIRSPDYFLGCINDSDNLAIASVIERSFQLFKKEMPDALFILGDTDSSMCAIAAKRLKIPVFHYEAGNRCFDFNVPEEINRRVIDSISDINLCYSGIAKQNLLNEGHSLDRVFNVGSPMLEVLNYYKQDIDNSEILEELSLKKRKYILVSSHRTENVDSSSKLKNFIETLNIIASQNEMPIIFSVHPRTRKHIESLGQSVSLHQNLILTKPFGFVDYIALQVNSRCVLSDSGTLTEESSILGFKGLNLRETNERQEGFESRAPMMVGYSQSAILEGLSYLDKLEDTPYPITPDYDHLNVSDRIYRLLFSYVNYVNKNVWKKI